MCGRMSEAPHVAPHVSCYMCFTCQQRHMCVYMWGFTCKSTCGSPHMCSYMCAHTRALHVHPHVKYPHVAPHVSCYILLHMSAAPLDSATSASTYVGFHMCSPMLKSAHVKLLLHVTCTCAATCPRISAHMRNVGAPIVLVLCC